MDGLAAKGIALIDAQVSLIRWPGGSQDNAITGWEIEEGGVVSIVTPESLVEMALLNKSDVATCQPSCSPRKRDRK